MKNSENAFKIVTAETQYLPVSVKSKEVTQMYDCSKTFSYYYFYLGTQNMPMIFCLKKILKTRFQ